MNTLWTLVAIAFTFSVFAVLAYWLFSAFGRHPEQFRDPSTGSRLWESPHLEMHGEYERTHETGSPHL